MIYKIYIILAFFKKLIAASKKKGYEVIKDWAHSISNHLYWCAASSRGVAEEMRAKWLSVTNHVANIHTGHGEVYPDCLHGELDERAWLDRGVYCEK